MIRWHTISDGQKCRLTAKHGKKLLKLRIPLQGCSEHSNLCLTVIHPLTGPPNLAPYFWKHKYIFSCKVQRKALLSPPLFNPLGSEGGNVSFQVLYFERTTIQLDLSFFPHFFLPILPPFLSPSSLCPGTYASALRLFVETRGLHWDSSSRVPPYSLRQQP